MTHTRLSVELPDGRWKTDVASDHQETAVSFPSMVLTGEHAVEVVTLSGETADSCLWAIQDHPDVVDSTVISRTNERLVMQTETAGSVLLSAATRAGTPLSFPVVSRDGRLVVDLLSTHERISALGDFLESEDAQFEVVHIQEEHERQDVLTERQQEVVAAADSSGYYETPRRCSLTELSEELGIAKSTCSGTLQRAEESIIDYFFADSVATAATHKTTGLARREIEP